MTQGPYELEPDLRVRIRIDDPARADGNKEFVVDGAQTWVFMTFVVDGEYWDGRLFVEGQEMRAGVQYDIDAIVLSPDAAKRWARPGVEFGVWRGRHVGSGTVLATDNLPSRSFPVSGERGALAALAGRLAARGDYADRKAAVGELAVLAPDPAALSVLVQAFRDDDTAVIGEAADVALRTWGDAGVSAVLAAVTEADLTEDFELGDALLNSCSMAFIEGTLTPARLSSFLDARDGDVVRGARAIAVGLSIAIGKVDFVGILRAAVEPWQGRLGPAATVEVTVGPRHLKRAAWIHVETERTLARLTVWGTGEIVTDTTRIDGGGEVVTRDALVESDAELRAFLDAFLESL